MKEKISYEERISDYYVGQDSKKPTKEHLKIFNEVEEYLGKEIRNLKINKCRAGYKCNFKTENYRVDLYVIVCFPGWCGISMAGPFYDADITAKERKLFGKRYEFTSERYVLDESKIFVPIRDAEILVTTIYNKQNPSFVKRGEEKLKHDDVVMECFQEEYKDNIKEGKSNEHLPKKYISIAGDTRWL